jgi:hypothetical protein
MKAKFFVMATLALIFLFNVISFNPGCTSKSPAPVAATPGAINNSSAILPLDVTSEDLQQAADSFSWRTFIAANWPANPATCGPDTANGRSILSGKGPVVWETYLTAEQVFVDAGSSPDGWCTQGQNAISFSRLPKKVQDLARKTGVYRVIYRSSKAPHGFDQAVGGPLVDQNGRFVRYEVRINQDEYNYITAHNLWNKAGQQKFVADSIISFPAGPSAHGPVGAMEFKAAWKVLGSGDDASRFYTIKAIVYNDDAQQDPSPGENPVTLGLVGLHIAHKTKTQQNWVWSTFEHVDNLTKSFYNPNCKDCPVNQSLPVQDSIELNPDGSPKNKPTQVTRVNAIEDPYAKKYNDYYQGLLKGSVWANYQLISTQWLLAEDIAPQFLANSVQETFVQGPKPPTFGNFKPIIDQQYFTNPAYDPFAPGISSSCMGCHYVASLPDIKPKRKADFSFLLSDAK